ncbi:MAG: Gfo/Idh/MocA family oxidoreductase [Bacillota bacterium]|nr:Gfo/Idh/MocA family oxidoreductase [Bacillota bacterium]
MNPKTAIIVGAGHRALLYASYSKKAPEKLKIIGVADPNPLRREAAAKLFGFGPEMCFESAETLAREGRIADFIINGTMDHQHLPTSRPLLELGYDMLLEKPFAVSEAEVFELLELSRRYGNTVMICHVLRYAPFYRGIKDVILSGEIGDVYDIQMSELVSYHHVAVSFVRGKWGNQIKCHAPMLLAKCCHDIDLMVWLKGKRPEFVSSFGGTFIFDPAKKPPGSGKRCMLDCDLVDDCLYSAKGHYIDHPDRWFFYVWDCLEHIENPTIEDKIESLRTDNIHGRCVWDCDHDNVDHQVVMVQFEDGATATLHMTGGTAKGDRSIHIVGTRGEIIGSFDDAAFTVRTIVPSAPTGFHERRVCFEEFSDTTGAFGAHGGGDILLVEDFVNRLNGEPESISATTIADSVLGHLLVFAAGEARASMQVVDLRPRLAEHGL